MNIKQSTLAAAVTAALAIGATGQAAASVYAGSSLLISDLSLVIVPTAGSVTVTGFSFTANSSAQLNGGAPVITNTTCSTIGTACAGPAPVLDSISNIGRPGATGFSFYGPGVSDTYAYSHSQIGEAQLVTAQPTTASQISESEVAGSGASTAQTLVSSQTTLLFSFSVSDSATLTLSFAADPDLFVKVDTLNLLGALATASTSATFELTSNNGTSVQWTPNGSASGVALEFDDCVGATCAETGDAEDLTVTRSLFPGNPSQNGFSDNRNVALSDLGAGLFGISLSRLATGTYTLGLTSTTFTIAEQTVPEPGVLALLGIGLLGMGMSARRSKKLA